MGTVEMVFFSQCPLCSRRGIYDLHSACFIYLLILCFLIHFPDDLLVFF